VVVGQIIINVVNALNNNNNNNNDNNNNNNNNLNNDNDNTFMITVTNSNTRRFHSVINVFSIINDLSGNPYGARYPWYWKGLQILNPNSEFYQSITQSVKQCVYKSICLMAYNRQKSTEKSWKNSIYKASSLFATAELFNHLSLSQEEVLKSVEFAEICEESYKDCPLQ